MDLVLDHSSQGARQALPKKRRLSVDDVRAMTQAGVLPEGAAVELFDGELFEMPPETPLNLDYAADLGRWLYLTLGREYAIIPGMSLVLSDEDYAKPEWWVFDRRLSADSVRGADALLVIEQSHSTLSFDLGYKANLYARHGVREYWVIDLAGRQVHVHRTPTAVGYLEKPKPAQSGDTVAALLIPALRLRLDDLPSI